MEERWYDMGSGRKVEGPGGGAGGEGKGEKEKVKERERHEPLGLPQFHYRSRWDQVTP